MNLRKKITSNQSKFPVANNFLSDWGSKYGAVVRALASDPSVAWVRFVDLTSHVG